MRHDKKRILKICEELHAFFFGCGAKDITTNIKVCSEEFTVTINSDYSPKHRSEMDNLTEYFHNEQNNEYFGAEEEYWGLMGATDIGEGTELIVLGMMVDRAEVEVTDQTVKLVLHIKPHK